MLLLYSIARSDEVHIIFSLFPHFPSWEGLGVGSSSLLPAPCSLKTHKFVPHKS
ncbi:hypothetical protein [Moorena sp. SIO3H5]|uniref:hypothetical protein n=1 Tax=Moorena sp. SIO3H5 TaxID=2607834 RepID=UPI0013BA5329|nr:hypothetical protein [Moorena sp. SIO3H5]NEO71206.1 hypothetical protein [Moorena sp. SIO3H5]